jgi:protein TonB
MRKLYHPPNTNQGWPLAVLMGLALTGFVFFVLPFTQAVSDARRNLELRRIETAAPPPPALDEPPPPPPPPVEEEPPPPPPQLAETPMTVPLMADLDMALGSGGAMAGLFDLRDAASELAGSDIFDVSELESRPEVVAQIAPVYPTELKKARIEGLVTMVFVVDTDGRVEDPRVENSSRPEFERPALEALRKWRFKPGLKEGEPVKTYLRLPIRFRVSGS